MLAPKFSKLSMALTVALFSNCLAVRAAITFTDADITSAIEKAKIFDSSIRLNARINSDEIMVSTYKNPKAADQDCKIDAVLVAKTIMDLAPGEVPRVTVYFYSASTLSSYKEVSVTAGDVKAFASGSLSKDELLSSIKIKEGTISDPKKRVEEHMQESVSQRRSRVITTLKGDEISLRTMRDSSMSDSGLKYEAFALAEHAFEAAPPEAKKVTVAFELGGAEKRTELINFSREDVSALQKSLGNLLEPFKIETIKGGLKAEPAAVQNSKIDIQKIELVDGPLKEERQKLLDRLKALNSAGVGYGTKPLDDFLDIEAKVGTDPEATTQDKISKLSELVGKFEENLKGAKEHKAVAIPKAVSGDGRASAGSASPAAAASSAEASGSIGNTEIAKAQVLANPDQFITNMAAGLVKHNAITGAPIGRFKTAEDHPNFQRNLQFVIDTLKANNRGAEAAKFQDRLDAIRAKTSH
ncbi:MAG: hypothetical protein KGS72_17455 [Cyanobacteria bacterium REEB67]|nr:hypothetical protein [Cyanobacteria bacterium REEB67]